MLPTQAILFTAGQSSRFQPFNERKTHKGNFSVCDQPLITHTIQALKNVGFTEIVVVHSPGDNALLETLNNITDISIITAVQEEALGQANALMQVAEHLHDRFLVSWPHIANIDLTLQEYLEKTAHNIPEDGIVLFGAGTNRPQDYGMIVGGENNKALEVVEKPQDNFERYTCRRRGIAIYTKDFYEHLISLPNHIYQNIHAMNDFAEKGLLYYHQESVTSASLKYPWNVVEYVKIMCDQKLEAHIDESAEIHETAHISGKVYIGKNVKIGPYTVIEGPVYIGDNVDIRAFCHIRAYSVIHKDVILRDRCEVKMSLIDENTHAHAAYIGNSVVGRNNKIGYGAVLANRRLDREEVQAKIKGNLMSTKETHMGSFLGDNVKVGANIVINPGRVISSNTKVFVNA